MKYYDIKEKLKELVIFSPKDVYMIDPGFRLPTLYDWESKGLVKKLRNNNYVFSDYELHEKDFYFIANTIYSPSYVSLETALSMYNVIPEAVQTITSITTNKTNKFNTCFGQFTYSSVSPGLFLGYKALENGAHQTMIATLEKTVLDYLYLNANIDSVDSFESLRWNKEVLLKGIEFKIFDKYLVIFGSNALENRCVSFMDFLNA